MPKSEYKPRFVRKKTREVVEYNYDDTRPGKPLHLLIPGGLIGIGSLCLIIGVVYQTWFQRSWETPSGIAALVGLIPVYIGGVFLFSYGYELYDTERAIRLTAIIVFTTLACVLIIAVLGALLGAAGKSDSKSSRRAEGKSNSNSSSSGNWQVSSGTTGTTRAPTYVDLNIFPETSSHAAVEPTLAPSEPVTPQPVSCSYCSTSFFPEQFAFTCPKCAAPYQVPEP